MASPRTLALLLATALLAGTPAPGDAQFTRVLDQARKQLDKAKETVADARALRCGAQGVCGEIRQAEHFAPASYESVAVTVFDGTNHFRTPGIQGMVRDAFESSLVKGGYLLAASSDAAAVREKIARGADAWSDEELKQLKEFVHGIDAVVVIEIRQLDVGRCLLAGDRARYGTEATAHISVRWLNADAGDIPWVATHKATVCEETTPAAAPTAALEAAAAQLAGSLPTRQAGKR